MGSSVVRLLSQRRLAPAWIFRSPSSSCVRKLGISTMSVSDHSRISNSPWLMLPPATFEGGDMVYNLYSLAKNKVLSLNQKRGGTEKDELLELLVDAQFVGSSHGWLALMFNRHINGGGTDLFLWNPLSRRHIKLPPLDTLPDPDTEQRDGQVSVSKVIISCSPDEEECRALMSFGPGDRLAFCLPGRSTEWTPIGASDAHPNMRYMSVYWDFVYCSRQKLFTCITREPNIKVWDLRDPRSPRMEIEWRPDRVPLPDRVPWPDRSEQEYSARNRYHLVFAEQSNELFLVVRHIIRRMAPDGSYTRIIYLGVFRGWDDSYPYKTIGFDVYKIDRDQAGKLRYIEGSLDGLAMFIGINHSFALSAADFPELKPNSIYFTDDNEFTPPNNLYKIYGGHDIGIFDYEDGTISPCYYPCDYQSIQRIVPAPMWFTPTPH